MFKFLRLFLIISLTSIVLTTALLTLVYRHVTIQATDNLTQASSLALAHAALISMRPELDAYLATVAGAGPQEFAAQRLAARINEVVKELMRNHPGPVVRVNLFNRVGVVIFSTDRDRIGQSQANNTGFISAINGRVANNLIYRDVFNGFDSGPEASHLAPNLMETYVPVRTSAADPVDAVFESYTDVSPLVTQNQNTAFVVLLGVGLLLSLLCGTLILVMGRTLRAIEPQHHPVVGRGLDTIDSQQHGLSERTAALETLSAKILSNDEMEKKKLAFGLHEGLAQTLIAIKMRIEHKLAQFVAGKAHDESLAPIIPLLQSAIDEVQRIATGLRPPILDELGLLPTIDWFCREFERRHPAIAVAEEISVQEDNVPAPLNIVIYRIIESAFANIARYESTDQIGLALELEDGAITLAIDDTSQDSRYAATAVRETDFDLQLRFGEAQERTTLTGGSFTIARNEAGGVMLRASWTV